MTWKNLRNRLRIFNVSTIHSQRNKKIKVRSIPYLTLCILMDPSFWFDAIMPINFRYSIVVFVFNIPPTAKVIWRRGHSLKSHPTDQWSRESNLRSPVYKASGLSTTPQRLQDIPLYIIGVSDNNFQKIVYSVVWRSLLPLQTVKTLMKCSIMLHFIWVFTVCKSTCLGISQVQRCNQLFACWVIFQPFVVVCWLFSELTSKRYFQEHYQIVS